jgi:hypothetical protein
VNAVLFSTPTAPEEHAQNGRGIKRTGLKSEFLRCLAARIRALCAPSRSRFFCSAYTGDLAGDVLPRFRKEFHHI